MRLNTIILLTAGLFLTSACANKRLKNETTKEQPGMDATRNLVIYYDQDTGNTQLLEAVQKYGAEVVYLYDALSGIAISIPDDKDIEEAISYFEKVPGVASVDRDGMMSIQNQMEK
ncbi:hypothetical protein M8998_02990 [Sphingobacterium sp. lm-10]|uniref:hypothetical protein n=1 Tax=Sphingobacterium sp. lm-10 TaxID=2944904 RepID=UPI0020211CBB|nr:hypothetical protein [Sphingobacterium sp. lm-10]MCL7986901.1 hypothetical protein [Sphingobacterium sp. lm-10]